MRSRHKRPSLCFGDLLKYAYTDEQRRNLSPSADNVTVGGRMRRSSNVITTMRV
jgi:hypothetical protein